MVSNFIANHSPVFFFSLVCTSFSSKNVCKKLGAFCTTNNRRLRNALLISLFGKTKGFFHFSFNNRSQKALPSFLHTFVLENEAQTSKKKLEGCDFLLNWRPHAKIQPIWMKKKQQKKTDQCLQLTDTHQSQLFLDRKLSQDPNRVLIGS